MGLVKLITSDKPNVLSEYNKLVAVLKHPDARLGDVIEWANNYAYQIFSYYENLKIISELNQLIILGGITFENAMKDYKKYTGLINADVFASSLIGNDDIEEYKKIEIKTIKNGQY